ncbi:MAG: alkaline phosphatase family protein [Candidatus Jordarchaeum sp.]|uniref:alkaline phosphatase family protein n=1 Tax=Candidatus Jordarchaeum sp. TaxID=2823881 RepID=UPI004048FDBD
MQDINIVKPLFDNEDLFIPNYNQNIFMAMPTAFQILGVKVSDRKTLFENKNCKRMLEENDCLEAKYVVNVMVDSLGTQQFLLADRFLKIYKKINGIVLSSIFPTITSAAIPSIHFGLPPERHGIMGHKILFPQLGTIVDTLKMASVKSPNYDMLYRSGIDVKLLLLEEGIYNILDEEDVLHTELLPWNIAGTGLSHLLGTEKNSIGYSELIDAFSVAKRILEKYEGRKTLINIYIGLLDSMSHTYGPFSAEYKHAMNYFETTLLNFIKSLNENIAKKSVLTLFSDHGQDELEMEKKIKLNETEIAEVSKFLRFPPGRSGRVLHFYVKEDCSQNLIEWLKVKIGDAGVAFTFDEVQSKLLPETRTPEVIRSRVGDVLLIMKKGGEMRTEKEEENNETEIIEKTFLGSHGSLTYNEITVPYLASNINRLKNLIQ